ncbi:component of RuvABC resolvasome, endonuclease [Nitrosomonas mobilis]|uniref:Crossover junction endodeoxyribonuclease RuvC n=1 Tax=Nitrosomonas mobilis TaxID=51642 RepID=A0A1G5SHB9_9PROT|nr:component of RuvABC resolvasome, endonuclease [Nitrosomonas mobilis]
MRITGFGVIDHVDRRLVYISSGCVTTTGTALPQRLKVILDGLDEIIREQSPEQVAIEQVFVNINPQSTLLLGQARGAAICAAVQHELSVAEYTALQIKQAVVGNGHAHKEQVQEMVMRLLELTGRPRPDAADALACAICHAHSSTSRFSDSLTPQTSRLRRGRRS